MSLGSAFQRREHGEKGANAIADLALVRIDDRLIHGQVMAVWVKHIKVDLIIVVDDAVAQDEFMQDVLRLAAPPGIKVEARSVQEGIASLGVNAPNREHTMVLVKTPRVARALFDGGVRFSRLNVGGIGGGPGRKSVFKNISMSEEDKRILRGLIQDGVKVTLLTVPGEQSLDFSMVK